MAIMIYGLDIVSILVTAGFVVFWGLVLIGFAIFYDKNPYVPRRYYQVILYDKEGNRKLDKDGNPVKPAKGWQVTTQKVKWFRMQLKGFPSFKGVEKDIAIMETMNKKGEIEIIEDIPDKYEPENYTPKNVPITQKEAFIKDVVKNISEESRPVFELKLREAFATYSRVVDLNTSKATKEYISQARREAERVKSDDFIYKYGPILSLIIAGLFAYMILDGSIKAYQATMAEQSGVMENGYSQVVQACGGTFHSSIQPVNNTKQATGTNLPFIGKIS